MKRVQMIILAIIFSFTCMVEANAGDKAVNGLLIGAGSGALIGSAAGRNTESALIGTAIGGVVGYAIGNSMEHPSRVSYHGDRHRVPVTHYQEYRPRDYYHHRPVRHYDRPYPHRYDYNHRQSNNCREVVTYRKDRGRVSQIVKTTCDTPRYYDRDRHRSKWYR